MTYTLINDLAAIREFESMLPDLGPNEVFFGALFARKKYCPDLIKSNDKTQLGRFTFKKGQLVRKIRQMEIPLGEYYIKDRSAPQESLVLYVNPNPRDVRKATFFAIKKLTDCLMCENQGFTPQQQVLSCIQNSKGSRFVTTLDIDEKDCDMSVIEQVLPDMSLYEIIETRGGYHVLLYVNRIKEAVSNGQIEQKWMPQLRELLPVESTGDMLSPCPGTTQGGFIPRLL